MSVPPWYLNFYRRFTQFPICFLHNVRGSQIIKFGTQLQFEKCSPGFRKFQRKAYVDIQLCSLQNAFSREAAFQILRTKYQIRSLEELINLSIGTMSMRCHEKFPDRSINPSSRRQFLWRSLCKTRFMKDAAVYRFAIEGSFDQISKHNDKNVQNDVGHPRRASTRLGWRWCTTLQCCSPFSETFEYLSGCCCHGLLWISFWMLLSSAPLKIFLDVIVTGSSPDWDCADVRCCATFCHRPQWTWPVTGKYHSLLKILLSMSMILKIFEIYLIKFCIYDWFVLLHLALDLCL